MRTNTHSVRSRLSLVSTGRRDQATQAPCLHASCDEIDALDYKLRSDECEGIAVIAGVVPVPSTISVSTRGKIEREMLIRFEFAEDLDQWLHASHDKLHGAAPYERLIAGDGIAVLRALLGVPINSELAPGTHIDEENRASSALHAARRRLVG